MIHQIKKYIAIIFLFLISLLIIPKEYIHALSGHEDTICYFHNNKILEKQHHHCAILNFNAPLYLTAFKSQVPVVSKLQRFCFINDYSFYFIDLTNLSSLRAPPTVVLS